MSRKTEASPTPRISFKKPQVDATDIGVMGGSSAPGMEAGNDLQLSSGLRLVEYGNIGIGMEVNVLQVV